jgi:carboxypeptidase Q
LSYKVKGKIVVYSSTENPLPTMIGASMASYFGAVAALTRTMTPLSLNTPHTGIQFYDPAVPKIPVAALSAEDADLLARLAKAGM